MTLNDIKKELAKLDITLTEFYYIYGKIEKLNEDTYARAFQDGGKAQREMIDEVNSTYSEFFKMKEKANEMHEDLI